MLNLQYALILLPFVVLFVMTLFLLMEEGFIAKPSIHGHIPNHYCPKDKAPCQYVSNQGWFYCRDCQKAVALEDIYQRT